MTFRYGTSFYNRRHLTFLAATEEYVWWTTLWVTLFAVAVLEAESVD